MDNQMQMSGILHKTKAYLSGPMEFAEGRNWRNQTKEYLKRFEMFVIDPYDKPFVNSVTENEVVRSQLSSLMQQEKYDEVHNFMKVVRIEDLRCCDLVDMAIVRIIPGVMSTGTDEEVVTMNRMKKPLFIVVEGGKKKTPLWIMGMLPHKYIYNSLEEVFEMLRKIDSGERPIDSDRWKLLKREYR